MYKLWHDSYLIYARMSSRTLHGSLIQDTDPDLVKLTGPILGRLTHQETLVPIFMCALIGTACLITAMVSISGYMISCNELQYETRRQVLGRTTLGGQFIHLSCLADHDVH